MAKGKPTVYRWKGDGTGYVPGVPQRDLTADEWEALPEALRKVAAAAGLYGADTDTAEAKEA